MNNKGVLVGHTKTHICQSQLDMWWIVTQNYAQLYVTNIIHKQMKERMLLMITSYLGFSCFTPELFSAAHGSFNL